MQTALPLLRMCGIHALPVGDVGAPAWCESTDFTCPLEKPGTNPCTCSWQGRNIAPWHGALHWQAPLWMQLLCVYQGCSVLAQTEVMVLVGWLLAVSDEVLMKNILLQMYPWLNASFPNALLLLRLTDFLSKMSLCTIHLDQCCFPLKVICFKQMSSDRFEYYSSPMFSS